MPAVFFGKVVGGVFKFNRSLEMQRLGGEWDGKKFYAQFFLEKSHRSLDQNAKYWVWLEAIATTTGYSKNELHEIFKRMFLPPRVVWYRDRNIRLPRSTTELNVSEMMEYMERVRAEAATMGVELT